MKSEKQIPLPPKAVELKKSLKKIYVELRQLMSSIQQVKLPLSHWESIDGQAQIRFVETCKNVFAILEPEILQEYRIKKECAPNLNALKYWQVKELKKVPNK